MRRSAGGSCGPIGASHVMSVTALSATGVALVFEAVALALDADYGRMMRPVEHRRGRHRVAGEGLVPRAEGQV